MKKQNLSSSHSALRRFSSVLLLLLFFDVLSGSKVKAQTTPQHEVSISLSANSTAEGNSGSNIVATGTVSVSNPTSLNFGVAVVLCFTGTATEGTDYTLVESNTMDRRTTGSKNPNCIGGGSIGLAFRSSFSSWSFRIRISGDGTIENDEAIIVSIATAAPSLPGTGNDSKVGVSSTAGSATFTILNDDFPTASSSADEDDGTVTVAVNLSAKTIMNTDVAYSVSGTAASAVDFSALSGTVPIISGSKTANISIPIIDDEADEPNETIMLTLSNGTGYEVGTTKVHTLTINDDDATPNITSDATVDVPEGTTRVLTVTATDTDDNDDDLTYSVSGGADRSLFSINRTSGVLTFATAPDFEIPTDEGRDNSYEVEVTASDGTNSVAQTITVTNDPNDDPLLAFRRRQQLSSSPTPQPAIWRCGLRSKVPSRF